MSTRVLLVSDTHGNVDGLVQAVENCKGQYDMVVHCGDSEMSLSYLQKIVGDVPIHIVQGNCDSEYDAYKNDVFEIEGHVCFLVHGHRQRVHWGVEELLEKAEEYGADVVFYGHTHVPDYQVDWDLGITVLNPGSLTFPRQDDRMRTYMTVEFREDGEIIPMISTVKGWRL